MAVINFGLGTIGYVIVVLIAGVTALLAVGFRGWLLALAPIVGIVGLLLGGILGILIGFFINGTLGLILSIVVAFPGALILSGVLRRLIPRQAPSSQPYPQQPYPLSYQQPPYPQPYQPPPQPYQPPYQPPPQAPPPPPS